MPRPVRRPKKVPQTTSVPQILQSTPKSTRISSSERSAHGPLGADVTIESRATKQTIVTRRAVSPPLSDDEFGFNEVRNIVPTLVKVKRRETRPQPIFVRPDSAEEEEEEDGARSILAPSSPPSTHAMVQSTTTTIASHNPSSKRQVLKTSDLLNLLPKAHHEKVLATTTTVGKRTRKRRQEVEEESDLSDHGRGTKSRSVPRAAKQSKTPVVAVAAGKVHHGKKTFSRRRNERHSSLVSDEDEAGSEEGDAARNDTLGLLSDEARRRLCQIRAQFEEVDEWRMETETVSSPFYSS